MSKDYHKMSQEIIKQIGGEDNVKDLYHCVTRLRFRLKDERIAMKHIDQIKNIKGVLTAVKANNQFQVVIGNDVDKAYAAIMHDYNIKSAMDNNVSDTDENVKEKGHLATRFFNTLSSIFNPIIMPLAGAGMIKALLVILTTFNLMSTKSDTYAIFSAAGNGVFYFLPLFLAISAARVFKSNQFVSLAIMAALLEPNFTNLITTNGVKVDFMGIPTTLMSYSSTVIPAILAIYIFAKVEKVLKKVVPKSLEIFLLPMLGLLIMMPLTVMIIGPIGVALGNGIGEMINFISQHSGWLAGAVIGGGWTYLVMIGIHWGVVPIMINNLSTYGYDTIHPMVAAATFASSGAALGVFFRAKDKETKSLALSSLAPALLGGVTEPIIYGLSIKYKRPLIAQTIAGAIAGSFIGLMHAKAIVYVFPALTTLPANFGRTFIYYVIGIALAFVLSAVLTYMLGLGKVDAQTNNGQAQKQTADNTLTLPVKGSVMPLTKVNDEVFSSKAMGEGVAIQPKANQIYAPISGKIETVFPTKHAIGIKDEDSGLEVLIHIGLNTVNLKGQGFKLKIKKGEMVKQGQEIGTVDFKFLAAKGYDTTTLLVVTNAATVKQFKVEKDNGEKISFNVKALTN